MARARPMHPFYAVQFLVGFPHPASLILPQSHCNVSSFAVPSGVMISRPCRTSYQSSPSSAIPCFPRDSLHVFRHPFCDVTAVWRLWSSAPSLPTHFPLDHTHLTSWHPLSLIVCPTKESLGRATNPRSCWWCLVCSLQRTDNLFREPIRNSSLKSYWI